MNAKRSILVLSLGFLTLLAPTAAADGFEGFGISFGKKSKHGAVSVHYTSGVFGTHKSKHRAPTCPPKQWIRGHYAWVPHQVWVPAEERTVWVEPVYETRYPTCGAPYQVCVAPGYWKKECTPGHYETKSVKAWQPGQWIAAGI